MSKVLKIIETISFLMLVSISQVFADQPKWNLSLDGNLEASSLYSLSGQLLTETDTLGNGNLIAQNRANDLDRDGVIDSQDNCSQQANPNQIDSDNDGFGNRCDADLNNSGGNSNSLDLYIYKIAHRSQRGDSNYNPDADLNSDGKINSLDLSLFRNLYRKPAGPGATTNTQAGQLKWSLSLGGNLGSSIAYNSITNNLYVGSADHSVYALDNTGNILWAFPTQGLVGASPALSLDGKTLYIASYDHHVYALNANTGQKIWSFDTGDIVYSSPSISKNGTIYVGSNNGYFYALDPLTGTEKWHFSSGGKIGSSAAIDLKGIVYIGSADGYLYAIDPADFSTNLNAKELWKFSTGAGVSSPAIDSEGTIYVGSFDHYLYAINSANGTQKWRTLLGGRVASSPAIDSKGRIYVSSFENGSLNALNITDGSIVWTLPLSNDGTAMYSSPAIGNDNVVYVGGFDGNLFAIDTKLYSIDDLSLMHSWRFLADSAIVSSPLITKDGTIYFSSQNDALYAIESSSLGLLNSAWPIFGRDEFRSGLQREQDSDADKMPDSWELAHSLNLNLNDADLDADLDGLTNYQEYMLGTNPNRLDTDKGGIEAGRKIATNLTPVENSDLDVSTLISILNVLQ